MIAGLEIVCKWVINHSEKNHYSVIFYFLWLYILILSRANLPLLFSIFKDSWVTWLKIFSFASWLACLDPFASIPNKSCCYSCWDHNPKHHCLPGTSWCGLWPVLSLLFCHCCLYFFFAFPISVPLLLFKHAPNPHLLFSLHLCLASLKGLHQKPIHNYLGEMSLLPWDSGAWQAQSPVRGRLIRFLIMGLSLTLSIHYSLHFP